MSHRSGRRMGSCGAHIAQRAPTGTELHREVCIQVMQIQVEAVPAPAARTQASTEFVWELSECSPFALSSEPRTRGKKAPELLGCSRASQIQVEAVQDRAARTQASTEVVWERAECSQALMDHFRSEQASQGVALGQMAHSYQEWGAALAGIQASQTVLTVVIDRKAAEIHHSDESRAAPALQRRNPAAVGVVDAVMPRHFEGLPYLRSAAMLGPRIPQVRLENSRRAQPKCWLPIPEFALLLETAQPHAHAQCKDDHPDSCRSTPFQG